MNLAKAVVVAGAILAGSSALYGLAKWDEARAAQALADKRFQDLLQVVDGLKKVDASLRAFASEPGSGGFDNPVFLDADLTQTSLSPEVQKSRQKEVKLYLSAKHALDSTIQSLKVMKGDGELNSVFVTESMTKAGALQEYSAVYKFLTGLGEAGWQAENGPIALANKSAKLAELKKRSPEFAIVDGVCSQAFGQEQGKILLSCMDMRLARPVVLMVDPGQYASSSYPLNGRFPVISRGVHQYSRTHANAFNTWQSTEMVPTFEVVGADVIDSAKHEIEVAKQALIDEHSRTNAAAQALHNALKVYGAGGAGGALPKQFLDSLAEYRRLCAKQQQTEEDVMVCQLADRAVFQVGSDSGVAAEIVQENYDRVSKEVEAAAVWVDADGR